jgi:hypothetical protein
MWPVERESIRSSVDPAGKETFSFRVRGRVASDQFDQTVLWFTVDSDSYRNASKDERDRAIEEAGLKPRLTLVRRLAPSAITETIGNAGSGAPIKFEKRVYTPPSDKLRVEVLDRDGNRVGRDGVRYPARYAMPDYA